jgi:hypothetical protein
MKANEVEGQLSEYLELGLTPVPLRGKLPAVKWKSWRPRGMKSLRPYIRSDSNWGIKTGDGLYVLDFDTDKAFFDFIVQNVGRLPEDAPVVKTGRGYHIWLATRHQVRNVAYADMDIKGEGGYVVAPPSRHPNGAMYYFVKPLTGHIPVVEPEELDFTGVAPKEYQHSSRPPTTQDPWNLEEPFNWSELENGVSQGMRHDALVKFVGWRIGQGTGLDDILIEAHAWNSRNRPPLSHAEVESTVRSCHQEWAVSNKTVNKKAIVVNGTGPVHGEDQAYSQPSESGGHEGDQDSPHADIHYADDRDDPWELEDDIDPYAPSKYCGHKRSVVRKGNQYLSVSFFCGRWSCGRCGPRFKQRWVKHIMEVTEGDNLYKMRIELYDWSRVRRALNRAGSNYMKVSSSEGCVLLINRPMPDAGPVSRNDLESLLDRWIPDMAPSCPVSTSRAWSHSKTPKTNKGYKLVVTTWLPLTDQLQIAKHLGAEWTVDRPGWLAPEEADEDEWENKFITAIHDKERWYEEWEPPYSWDVEDIRRHNYEQDDRYEEAIWSAQRQEREFTGV